MLKGPTSAVVASRQSRLPRPPRVVSGGRHGERGLAILEVMIAGVILVIAIVGLALMFGEGQSYVVAEGDDRVAIALAQEKLEAVRALGFGCIPVGGPGTPGFIQPRVSISCPDDTNAQAAAARTYNEAPLGRYTSRTVVVECADASMAVVSPCVSPIVGRKITVEITPQMAKAKPLRVEAFVALH